MEISFIKGPAGKVIPVQKVRQIYKLEPTTGKLISIKPDAAKDCYVSHFETCPNASEFTRRSPSS